MRFMTNCIIAAAMMASAFPANAALSGYWDSAKILHVILGDAQLADALKQQPIDRIEKTAQGYKISSRDCTVQIRVSSVLPDHPGPARHTISIGKGRCR